MREEELQNLINRRFAGQLSDAEEKSLQKWLRESDENRQVYAEIEKIWQRTQPKNSVALPDVRAEWSAIQARLGITIPEEKARVLPMMRLKTVGTQRFIQSNVLRWSAVAAAAILILIVSQVFLSTGNRQVYATQNAERRNVELADGTSVRLNVASEIEFSEGLQDSVRRVFLQGQAFFDVARDGRPFVVQTENAQIRVLGTSFDIHSRDNQTRVIVKEGRVMLQTISADSRDRVVLQANEKSIVSGKNTPTPVESVNADYLIGWLNNRFVFHQTPLHEVIAELQRRYDTRIRLQTAALGERSMSGVFEEQEIDTTLSVFCQTLNLKYSFQNGSYLIYH